MRNRLPTFLAAAWSLAVLVCLPAQGASAQGAPPQGEAGPEQALAAWRDAKGDRQRSAALMRVGKVDDARATAILRKELKQADGAWAVTVLNAIAQVPRRELLTQLRDVLSKTADGKVRSAAAAAIAAQGSQGIDHLAVLASRDGTTDAVRAVCLRALGAVKDDRAWRALAPFTLEGSDRQRMDVLQLLNGVTGNAAVTRARLQLIEDRDSRLAAVAWRQLAEAGHDRARWIFEDLVDALGSRQDHVIVAELLRGMPHVLEAGYFPLFLQLATHEHGGVRAALREKAKAFGKDAALVQWLVTAVLRGGSETEREVAMVVVREAPAAVVGALLADLRDDILRADSRALDLVVGLRDFLAADQGWKQDVLGLCRSPDAAVRTVGLAMMLELGAADAVDCAQAAVEDAMWQLRSIAYRYLTRFRDLSSIPVLIGRAGKEQGRLDLELGSALFVHTGVRCWSRSEWDDWWRRHRATHALPAWESVRNVAGPGGGATVAYYGIPLASKRVAFVVDVSGSMNAKIGTDRKRTRLDEAKRQLGLVVEKLDQDFVFNVITYETRLHPVWGTLRAALPDNKKEVLERVQKAAARGGTNIHDALELAFADPDVDTVYLLSDGDPSAGAITDVDDLADAVRRWNYRRQITIHGIAVGKDSKLLRQLAADSGGQYVHAR